MNLWHWLSGQYRVTLVSADPAGTLEWLAGLGIGVWDISAGDPLTWEFSVLRRHGRIVQRIAHKRGDRIRFTGHTGAYWIAGGLKKRPVLLLGMAMLLLLSIYLPTRVLFVRVEGNRQVPARLILQETEACGVYFGADRSDLRSQQLKDRLLSRLPQLQWAGVKTEGCVAVITVRERIQTEQTPPQEGVCSIVSARDAVVVSMTVLRGNGLCKPGQAVKAGQVLISGYTDCGLCIRAERADGEILGRTQRELTAIFPEEYDQKTEIQSEKKKFSLIIGKKQINFFKDSGISGTSCAKIYEQKYMTLPGGFRLPVSILCQTEIRYKTEPTVWAGGEALISSFAKQYVLRNTSAGILEYSSEQITQINGCIRLQGIYGCLENLGLVRMEESIPDYGKSD